MEQYAKYEYVQKFERYKNESLLVSYVESYSMLKFTGEVKNKEILDLGCGYGYYSKIFAENGAKNVLGIDNSEAMIAVAKSIKEQNNLQNLDYVQVDAADFKLAKKFDIIFVNQVLNHAESVEHLKKICQNMFDHLKAGGKALCSINNGERGVGDTDCYHIRNYGFIKKYINSEESYWDGKPYIVELIDKNRETISFITDTWYYNSTMEVAFRKAGFDVQFRHYMISREGFEKFGEDFWKPFIDECPALVIVARKTFRV